MAAGHSIRGSVLALLMLNLMAFYPVMLRSQEKSLDYYLDQGLANSPLLNDLNNQIRDNAYDSLLLLSPRHPQIIFNGALSYAPVINGYGYSEAITNGGNFISTINLSQPLLNRKTTLALNNNIVIQNDSLKNTIHISTNQLKKSITEQYLEVYTVQCDIIFQEEFLKSLENEGLILKEMTANGVFKQTDYLSFKIEIQARRLMIDELRIRYSGELSKLNSLCGLRDSATYRLVLPELNVNMPVPRKNSGFFRMYRLDSLAIRNQKLLIDRSYKPNIYWNADAGLMNNDPRIIYKNFGASIGLSMTLPLLDGSQKRLNQAKLDISEETRRYYQTSFELQFDENMRQLTRQLELTKQLMPEIREELAMAETVVTQDKELLNSGGISVTDYLLAVRNYLDIQQHLTQYEIKILLIINEINYWRQ